MSRRYDDHYGSGPYHSEGTFYPSGHPSTHRSSSRSSSTYHSSSAYSSGRASNDPHHRRDRPHCPSPSPPRAYSPPSPARDSRSSNTHSSCTEHESAQSSQPPPCPESQQQPFTSSRDTSTVAYTYDDEEPDTIPHAPAPWNNFASFSTREKLVSFFVSQGFSKETAERSREGVLGSCAAASFWRGCWAFAIPSSSKHRNKTGTWRGERRTKEGEKSFSNKIFER
jgi:hypothetical protein